MCERCGRGDCAHVGVCGEPFIKLGVEDQCRCLVATPTSLNSRELRTREVIQQADIRELQRRDWDALGQGEQERIRRRVPYRRLKS